MTTARTSSGDVDRSGSSDHGWLGQNHGTASVILCLTDVTPGTVFATCSAWLLCAAWGTVPVSLTAPPRACTYTVDRSKPCTTAKGQMQNSRSGQTPAEQFYSLAK
jgi:hypothetical protein